VELHTVYASQVRQDGCDPETLECCQAGPFLVRAFAARVAAHGPDTPILPPPGLPLAEWSGSTTGADKEPEQCKPAAQWSFRLGCDFTLSEAQLHRFRHADLCPSRSAVHAAEPRPHPRRPLGGGRAVSADSRHGDAARFPPRRAAQRNEGPIGAARIRHRAHR
jgi:hypothetical protein